VRRFILRAESKIQTAQTDFFNPHQRGGETLNSSGNNLPSKNYPQKSARRETLHTSTHPFFGGNLEDDSVQRRYFHTD
jgi:hypothetical protein